MVSSARKWAAFIFALAPIFIETSLNADDTYIYLVTNKQNVGERNQVLGIANALKQKLSESGIQKEFDIKEKAALLEDISQTLAEESDNKGIIIAAELNTIDLIKDIKHQPNIVIVHSSHQITKKHEELTNQVDLIALPKHILTNKSIEKLSSPYTSVIQTVGVAHNLSPSVIKDEYTKYKDKIPPAEHYIGVILGGDAPNPEGKMLYYTEKEARKLATYIAKHTLATRSHLLVLNGPRTGKHDQKTHKILETSHRNGHSDPVTQAFVDELRKQGLKEESHFTLFDFQFEQPSYYKAVLGALLSTNGSLFVAGESTSMVSEAADTLPQGLVTAYIHSAMNQNHKRHCQEERKSGRIHILSFNKKEKSTITNADSKDSLLSTQSAAEVIAEKILELLRKKSETVLLHYQ